MSSKTRRTVDELNDLAEKMTGENPKARTDAEALNYIEQNYQGGGSSGGGATHILDFTEFFNRMDYPSVMNTSTEYRLNDMVSWGQISQEFVDKLYEDFSKIDNNNIGVIGIANISQGITNIEYPIEYWFQEFDDGWIDRGIKLKRELREGNYIKTYSIEIYFGEENGVPDDVDITVTYLYKLQIAS